MQCGAYGPEDSVFLGHGGDGGPGAHFGAVGDHDGRVGPPAQVLGVVGVEDDGAPVRVHVEALDGWVRDPDLQVLVELAVLDDHLLAGHALAGAEGPAVGQVHEFHLWGLGLYKSIM